jgi:hypothetical protein
MVVATPIRRAELAEAFARDAYLRLPPARFAIGGRT